MRVMFTIIFILGGFLSPSSSLAGPFGFDLSTAPDTRHCKKLADRPLYYKCETAPRLHSDFEYVVIKYHPEIGLCMLKGVGRNVDTNLFGSDLKIRLEKISNQVSSIYGEPSEVVDFLFPGSIWDEPEDYMMSLVEGERLTFTTWDVDPEVHSFNKVGVMQSALRRDTGYVSIEYYFPKNDDCNEIIDNNEASSF